MIIFDLIFMRYGGVTLQSRYYSKKYSDLKKLAMDVAGIIAEGDDPRYWDDNNPSDRIVYEYHTDESGELKWVSNHDLGLFMHAEDDERAKLIAYSESPQEKEFLSHLCDS